MMGIRRCSQAVLVAALLATAQLGAPAGAVPRPSPGDPRTAPAAGDPAPPRAMQRNKPCAQTLTTAGTNYTMVPPPVAQLNLPEARKYSTGAGVKVAVVDTGVQQGPRLRPVVAGGDYVEAGGDGRTDCDSHGTVVAFTIAGQPSPDDAASGVAPDAQIISIRQSSAAWSPSRPDSSNPNDPNGQTAGDISTLAMGIRRAADLAPRGVINVSIAAYIDVRKPLDQKALLDAVAYATLVKDAVVVTAAGNTSECRCVQNPLFDAGRPGDPRNWSGVNTIVTPAWSPHALAVGATDASGQPLTGDNTPTTVAGPWVGIGAPGVGIVGPDIKSGRLINGLVGEGNKPQILAGSSFAAAFVSGTAALVRSRYPQLTAPQVIARLVETAHRPARGENNLVGAGLLDPVAAVSSEIDPKPAPGGASSMPVAAPVPPAPVNTAPQRFAAIALGSVAGLFVIAGVVGAILRNKGR